MNQKKLAEPRVAAKNPIMVDLNAKLKLAYADVLQVLSDYHNSLEIERASITETES